MRDSDSKAPLLVQDLNKMMQIELQDAILKDVTELVDTIFPDKDLPFYVGTNLLQSLTGVYGANGWINPPDATESAHADWLNLIGILPVVRQQSVC
jgi:hypothetical protein